tara:strand:+ start:444 stop:896 length:453 start_codon:yes stop_codon:yes gene_type:complete
MKDKLPRLNLSILPQPEESYKNQEFIQIPNLKRSKYVPFGYKISEEDPDMLDPIPNELIALEKAKKYLRQYSSRQVARWLTKATGRSISHTGLLKRIKDEIRNKTKASALREWARRLEKALQIAEKIEKTRGCKEEKRLEAEADSARRVC